MPPVSSTFLRSEITYSAAVWFCLMLCVLNFGCASRKNDSVVAQESRISPATTVDSELIPVAIILEREISDKTYGKRLSAPGAIRQDHLGYYFLIDRGNHRILKFDSAFTPVGEFGNGARSGERLGSPNRIALDRRGNVFLTDTELREIVHFDDGLNLVREILFLDTSDALKFGVPGGLGVDSDGMLWVSDYERARFAIFNRFGDFEEFYADFNSGGSHLDRPGAMFPRMKGGMFVCDESGGEVFEYNSYGVQIGAIGGGILSAPVDVNVDGGGRVWVCDSSLAEILCFARSGELLFRTGDLGPAYKINLKAPTGICFRDSASLIISDSGADRILICRIIFSS